MAPADPSWDVGVAGGEEEQLWDLALLGCSSRGGTGECHLLLPLRVRIVARVGCEGWGCWTTCAPAPSPPPRSTC